jgi:restriction endonuclease S subunit
MAEIRMGATLRGRDATRAVPTGSCHLIRIGDISQDGTWLKDAFVRIEPNEPVKVDLFLRPGDVLFPNRGTRATAIVYSLNLPNTLAGAQFFILRPNPDRVLPEYLAWFLRTEEAARYFEGRRKGTYVQIIQRSDLAEMEMPVPPLAVQRKIVDVASLALAERAMMERLARLKSKLLNGQLMAAAMECGAESPHSTPNDTEAPKRTCVHEED